MNIETCKLLKDLNVYNRSKVWPYLQYALFIRTILHILVFKTIK